MNWKTLLRIAGAAVVGIAAVPWITSHATTPTAFGIAAVAASLCAVITPHWGRLLVVALALTLVGLCGLAMLFQPPLWAPLEIDGVPFVGWMYAMPIAVGTFAVSLVASSFVERLHRPGDSSV